MSATSLNLYRIRYFKDGLGAPDQSRLVVAADNTHALSIFKRVVGPDDFNLLTIYLVDDEKWDV